MALAGGQVIRDAPGREALAQSDVEPPQIMRLASGLGIADRPLRVEEFVSALTHGVKG
jgi:hypothetical protein